MTRCLLALHRIGPYHHARFQAVASLVDLHVLETRPGSKEYPWDFTADPSYVAYALEGQPAPDVDSAANDLDKQLDRLIDEIQPDVVVSVGWADRSYQRLLIACHRRCLPLVIVSDSRERDVPRSSLKEWIKRQLLRAYSSALVAGTESLSYLVGLGFPKAAISQPCDVVDNDLFAACSSLSASESIPPFFLCVSRLIEKKNHRGLLEAYATYQRHGGAWGLKLIGSGCLEPEIHQLIAQLPEPSRAELYPFQQLPELLVSYAQASAFVLASRADQWGLVVNEAMAAGLPCLISSACGCAADLIDHGRTGWAFDPNDSKSLAALMHQVEFQSLPDRLAMQQAARQRLDAFSLRAFASGFQHALERSISHPRRSRRASFWANLLSRVS